MTKKRMQALRFSNDEIDAVARLVELHLRFHGYGSGEWTDSAVRRYVRDAGPLLERLHVLTRADCTTRNRRKAERLKRTYDDLEARIARLAEEEELASIRPDLDGQQIMEILGIEPGPEVGKAYRFLLERRMDLGPMSEEQATEELLSWCASQHVTGRSARGIDQARSRRTRPRQQIRTAYDLPSSGMTSAPTAAAATKTRLNKHVVEREDPAPVGVVDVELDEGVDADLDALRGEPERERGGQQPGLGEQPGREQLDDGGERRAARRSTAAGRSAGWRTG